MRTDEWADAAAATASRPASGWCRRHVSRATASALEVGSRPAGHEAAAGAVGQPGERAQPLQRDELGGHRAAGLLPALARERPGADEGVEQRRRRRRRGRDVGEEARVVEGDVVRQQHVVDERQRLVEPEPTWRDGAQGGDVGRRRRPPERGVGREVVADPAGQLVGQPGVVRRPAVELHGVRLAGAGPYARRRVSAPTRTRIAPDLRRRQILEATHRVTLARGLHDLRVADVAVELARQFGPHPLPLRHQGRADRGDARRDGRARDRRRAAVDGPPDRCPRSAWPG